VQKYSAAFTYRPDRNKLRHARGREGRYLLHTNLTEHDHGYYQKACALGAG
jgi:hypothetical protein